MKGKDLKKKHLNPFGDDETHTGQPIFIWLPTVHGTLALRIVKNVAFQIAIGFKSIRRLIVADGLAPVEQLQLNC